MLVKHDGRGWNPRKLKGCHSGKNVVVSFTNWLKGGCGSVNSFSSPGYHGRAGDCSNYYTKSQFVATVESKPIYLCPCGAFQFTWKAQGGGDWYGGGDKVVIVPIFTGNVST